MEEPTDGLLWTPFKEEISWVWIRAMDDRVDGISAAVHGDGSVDALGLSQMAEMLRAEIVDDGNARQLSVVHFSTRGQQTSVAGQNARISAF
jgi:hypothetical protein